MNKSLLLIFLIGGIIAIGVQGTYLIYVTKFKTKNWLEVSLLGLLVGLIFTYLLPISFALFFVLLALCSAVIINSINPAKDDEKIEFMVVALGGGTFIGLVSMVGCCVICA